MAPDILHILVEPIIVGSPETGSPQLDKLDALSGGELDNILLRSTLGAPLVVSDLPWLMVGVEVDEPFESLRRRMPPIRK